MLAKFTPSTPLNLKIMARIGSYKAFMWDGLQHTAPFRKRLIPMFAATMGSIHGVIAQSGVLWQFCVANLEFYMVAM